VSFGIAERDRWFESGSLQRRVINELVRRRWASMERSRRDPRVRLYASTYPLDVLGLILVDAYSERLETLLTPGRWSALVRFNVRSGSDTIEPIPSYGDFETIGFGKDNVMMRQATATTPLRGARCRLR
jgi:hypothetical protein